MKLKHPYCEYCVNLKDENDVDKIYHDHHYGIRIEDDNELFCRLVMEINQAGLSWRTILMKEKGLRKAYHNFDIKKVAKYGDVDFTRLMNDAGIIRNRLKIHATIHNAKQLLLIQKEFGSFRKWLDVQQGVILTNTLTSIVSSSATTEDPVSVSSAEIKKLWLKLFKKHFKFVGGEIVGEFLMSIDMLPGAHDIRCIRQNGSSRGGRAIDL